MSIPGNDDRSEFTSLSQDKWYKALIVDDKGRLVETNIVNYALKCISNAFGWSNNANRGNIRTKALEFMATEFDAIAKKGHLSDEDAARFQGLAIRAAIIDPKTIEQSAQANKSPSEINALIQKIKDKNLHRPAIVQILEVLAQETAPQPTPPLLSDRQIDQQLQVEGCQTKLQAITSSFFACLNEKSKEKEKFLELMASAAEDANPQVYAAAVRFYAAVRYNASDDVKDDEDCMLAAALVDPSVLDLASPRLKDEKGFVLKVLEKLSQKYNSCNFRIDDCYSPRLQQDEDVLREFVKLNPSQLQHIKHSCARETIKGEKSTIMVVVSKDGSQLKFASDNMKNDPEVVLAAASNYGGALADANRRFWDNREFVLAAVKGRYHEDANTRLSEWDSISPLSLTKKFENDEEIVLASVANRPSSYKFAGADLKKNPMFLRKVIPHYGAALKDAGPDLRNEEALVLKAIAANPSALEYASDDLKNKESVVMAAIAKNGVALQFANPRFKINKAFVEAAYRNNPDALEHADISLRDDPDFIKLLLAIHPRAIVYATPKIQNDKVFMLSVVKQNGSCFKFGGPDVIKDKEIARAALHSIGQVKRYIDGYDGWGIMSAISNTFEDDPEFLLEAIPLCYYQSLAISKRLVDDAEFMLKAIRIHLDMLSHASERLLKDPDFMVEAVKVDPFIWVSHVWSNTPDPNSGYRSVSLNWAHENLLQDPLFILKVLEAKKEAILKDRHIMRPILKIIERFDSLYEDKRIRSKVVELLWELLRSDPELPKVSREDLKEWARFAMNPEIKKEILAAAKTAS